MKMSWDSFSEKTNVGLNGKISPSTIKQYNIGLHTYEKVIAEMKTIYENVPDAYPITEEKIRNSLEFYRQQHPNTTYAYLKQIVASISYYFRLNNLPNLTLSESVSNYLFSLKRQMHTEPPKAKLPFTQEIMCKLAENVNLDFQGIRFITMASFCFYGFLRISECCNLQKNDAQLNSNGYLTVKVSASKTDQEGKSCTIFIYESNTTYSAIKWFTEYQKFISSVSGSNLFGIDQRRFRILLKNNLKQIGLNITKYSTHSFRKGAASCAAKNGIQDCQIKAMGRWLSDCYQRYTAVTMQEAGEKITKLI